MSCSNNWKQKQPQNENKGINYYSLTLHMMKIILIKKDVQNPLFPKILPVYLNKFCRKDAIKIKIQQNYQEYVYIFTACSLQI